MYRPKEVQPVSDIFFTQVRLNVAIRKLYDSVEDHNQDIFDNQVSGINISVGIRIFIIGGR